MILTIILILIIFFILFQIRKHKLFGKNYYINKVLPFVKFHYFLNLLKDANSDAKASILFPKAQLKFEIIKRQNEKEWWFELRVNKRKRKIFKDAYFIHYDNKIIYSKRKMILYLGYDIQKIYDFLENVFIKNMKIDKGSKISAMFINTRVLNGIEYYMNKPIDNVNS